MGAAVGTDVAVHFGVAPPGRHRCEVAGERELQQIVSGRHLPEQVEPGVGGDGACHLLTRRREQDHLDAGGAPLPKVLAPVAVAVEPGEVADPADAGCQQRHRRLVDGFDDGRHVAGRSGADGHAAGGALRHLRHGAVHHHLFPGGEGLEHGVALVVGRVVDHHPLQVDVAGVANRRLEPGRCVGGDGPIGARVHRDLRMGEADLEALGDRDVPRLLGLEPPCRRHLRRSQAGDGVFGLVGGIARPVHHRCSPGREVRPGRKRQRRAVGKGQLDVGAGDVAGAGARVADRDRVVERGAVDGYPLGRGERHVPVVGPAAGR